MPSIDPAWTAMAPNGPVIWSTDIGGTINWTATAGTPTSDTGAGFPWMAPSSAQTVRITASNGTITLIRDVVVTSYTFPYQASLAVEGTVDDVALLHTMETGARRGRRKTPPKGRWDLTFRNRTLTEYNAALALFDSVGKLSPFTMEDPITGAILGWYFDSAVTRRYGGRSCAVDYSFKVVEA